MTATYTLKKGGSYERFKMMVEALLEKECEVHCLSLVPIGMKHSFFHSHVIPLPLKKVDGLMAKWLVLVLFPLWSFWIGWSKRIDLFIAFGSLYAFIQAPSKRFLRKPMVTLVRGSSSFGLKMQGSSKIFLLLNQWMERKGLYYSDRIITNNITVRNEILGSLVEKKNVEVLFNNIPSFSISIPEKREQIRARYGVPENSKVLVTAGMLNRGKHIETLIHCLTRIGVENLYLLIVGDGSSEGDFRYRDTLKALVKDRELDQRILFTGWVEKEELWKIYLASDLFVSSSWSEGMPNAMLEALGAGMPCIGSDIPGVRDILHYGELLFDPFDEKLLDAKIKQFFSDSQFFNRVKRLCLERKKAFEFDWGERIFQMVTTGFNPRLEETIPT